MKYYPYLVLLLFTVLACNGPDQRDQFLNELGHFRQIKSNRYFNSNQVISIFAVAKKALVEHQLKIVSNDFELHKTSDWAINNKGLFAINGSFFNVEDGGSVCYLEENGDMIADTNTPDNEWSMNPDMLTGVVLIDTNFVVHVEAYQSDSFYIKSKRELGVLLSGPHLIKDSVLVPLAELKFNYDHHPRTLLGIKNDSVLFITVDGRQSKCDGFNMFESQSFLLELGCIDAMNLDGGGSSTMYSHDKGILNYPSDMKGERKVANALVILPKK